MNTSRTEKSCQAVDSLCGRWGIVLLYLAMVLGALWLRIPHFNPLSTVGPDGSEYAYCVRTNQLPHSPYILYLWLGYLISPFFSLDFGLSLLSLCSVLVAIPFFGLMVWNLTESCWAGLVAAWVVAISPVSIRYAGLQEVYAVQFLLLVLTWWMISRQGSAWLIGFLLGMAIAVHSGTAFALLPTLVLWERHRKRPWMLLGGSIETVSLGQWTKLVVGMTVMPAICVLWLVWVWWPVYGAETFPLLPIYLRGLAPGADISQLTGRDGLRLLVNQLGRTVSILGSLEGFGIPIFLGGTLALVMMPLRLSTPWLALAGLYLFYEFLVGLALDYGIYICFVMPSLAVALGYAVKAMADWRSSYRNMACGLILLGTLIGGVWEIPKFYHTAWTRSIQPWYRPEGSTMALTEWVRDHSPEESLVIQPSDWVWSGQTINYYSRRRPIFVDSTILLPGPWKPLFTHPIFDHNRIVRDMDLQQWLREERPILSYDVDPFYSFLCDWPRVTTERYTTSPVLWLDRNQSGTSELWRPVQILADVAIGNATEEQQIDLSYHPDHRVINHTLPIFRPCLYRVKEVTPTVTVPDWVLAMRQLVPTRQHGAPPILTQSGILLGWWKGEVEFTFPPSPAGPKVVRLVTLSQPEDFLVECAIKTRLGWKTVSRDMERIVTYPRTQFVEFYFPLTEKPLSEAGLRVKLFCGQTSELALYRIQLALCQGDN